MAGARAKLRVPVSDADHVRGASGAPLELVEYGDYQCPHCGRAYPVVEDAVRALGDELRFVFRHFPLTQLHPHAMNAARIAEAAARQGKFWDMHAALYQNQQRLDDPSLVGHAERLGLDLERLGRDANSAAVEERILADQEGGVRSGVNGTPTFYVNGVRFDGDWENGGLLDALRAARRSP